MAKQEFCLKWNNHHPTVLSIVDRLFLNEALVDVTLVAEGRSLKVHRLILAACSTYFQEIVDQYTEKAMVIFLRDVKFVELEALVHYMYRGEVKIAQSNLSSLIRTAESLRIKGLAETEDDDCGSPVSDPLIDRDGCDRELPSRKKRRGSSDTANDVLYSAPVPLNLPRLETRDISQLNRDSHVPEVIPDSKPVENTAEQDYQALSEPESCDDLQSKVLTKIETNSNELELTSSSNIEDEWNDEDFSLLAGETTENGINDSSDQGSTNQQGVSLTFSCRLCCKKYNNKTGLLRHTRTVCERRAAVVCQYCRKIYSRKDNLRTHIRRNFQKKCIYLYWKMNKKTVGKPTARINSFSEK